MSDQSTSDSNFDIAIIGMAGRFPGAKNIDEFWANLSSGKQSVQFFSDEELEEAGIDPRVFSDPNYVKASPTMEGHDLFDASFFGYSPREAQFIDPQHRIFLENCWQSLEHAGYDPARFDGSIGVFGGSAMNTYLLATGHSANFFTEYLPTLLGSDKDFLTTRVSYKLNLTGPSVAVQTACSSSLVAVHLACQSLLNHETDMAIAGGVAIKVPHHAGYMFEEHSVFTPDGVCRPFDANAKGTIFGSGVGSVILKRLDEALEDHDTIHAIIKGSAINNDGSSKIDYTAPSVNSQAEAIVEAMGAAGITADTVSYVEAHGTGTYLGDPIEVKALTKAFSQDTQEKEFCAIGSVKSNIGHLDAAAGVAGLIKTVLSLKNRQLPASINFDSPNPEINFKETPFYVNDKLSDWINHRAPLRAGITSLGMGGTNAHVILEESTYTIPTSKASGPYLFTLSAKSKDAVAKICENLAGYLKATDEDLSDVAYTFNLGRQKFNYRTHVVGQDKEELIQNLESVNSGSKSIAQQEPESREVVFMFSGQGSQYVSMAAQIYDSEEVFRASFDQCADYLLALLGVDIRTIVYPDDNSGDQKSIINQTAYTQPILFTVEYALAQLWMSLGVTPSAVVGHSIGEYAAACVAGVMSLEDALTLVVNRGRLMQDLPAGDMLAIPLPETEVQKYLDPNLSIAVINSPLATVVSGPQEAVQGLIQKLKADDVNSTLLHTSHAFHSPMMDPILKQFEELVKGVTLTSPKLPILSNVTGEFMTDEQATSPEYWASHIRQTVRFADCLEQLMSDASRIFLEVGPGQTLSTFAKQHPQRQKGNQVVSSLRHPKQQESDTKFLLDSIAQLWKYNVDIDWSELYKDEQRKRVPAPTYPFESKRHWIKTGTKKTLNLQESIYKIPSWRQEDLVLVDRQMTTKPWVLFINEDTWGVYERLKSQKQNVFLVKQGGDYAEESDLSVVIDPSQKDHYLKALKYFKLDSQDHINVLHGWSVYQPDLSNRIDQHEQVQQLGFYSLVYLAQAIYEFIPSMNIKLGVVTNDLFNVNGYEQLLPEKGTVLGPCKVIPREFENIDTLHLDIHESLNSGLADQLLIEFENDSETDTAVFRGDHRWVMDFKPTNLKQASNPVTIKKNGNYLILGGTGGVGHELARYVSGITSGCIVLLGTSQLPPRNQWEKWIEDHDSTDPVVKKLHAIQTLEKNGAAVEYISADITNPDQMRSAMDEVRSNIGEINGVINAAGVINDQLLVLNNVESMSRVLNTKVLGTLILESLFDNSTLDFWISCSSVNAIIGTAGQSDYVAANQFLDLHAQLGKKNKNTKVISINWPGWKETGMMNQFDNGIQPEGVLENAISKEEGVEAFSTIIEYDFSQVVVFKTDILEYKESLNNSGTPDQNEAVGSLDNFQDPTEKTIAEIWQSLLGVEELTSDDNFFELGGSSLIGIKLISRMREIFDVELSIKEIFDAPTIQQMAAKIQESKSSPQSQEKDKTARISALLRKVQE